MENSRRSNGVVAPEIVEKKHPTNASFLLDVCNSNSRVCVMGFEEF